MHDIVIRNGKVIDGTGRVPFVADVAIEGDRIVEVTEPGSAGPSRRTIEADGLLVTPGFVDVHTHYDAQAMWDPTLGSSCWHGVTTAVIGNCGVGFAPVRPEHRGYLTSLMEGVEDIPAAVLDAGLSWRWETFPQYLDVLDALPRALDVAALVPHAPLRVYAMGERAFDGRNQPTVDELAHMSRLVQEAIEAGAVGVATLRTQIHRTSQGELMPTYCAGDAELGALAAGMLAAGRGMFEAAADYATDPQEVEFERFRRLTAAGPFTMPITQTHGDPDDYKVLLDFASRANADGCRIVAQVAVRPVARVLGLDSTSQWFAACASYEPLAHLPLARRVERMRDPELRARLCAEAATLPQRFDFDLVFPIVDPVDYEPDLSTSIGATARSSGQSPLERIYDVLLEDDGQSFIYCPTRNFAGGTAEAVRDMLLSPHTVPGLGDGGAHATYICDMSNPTTLLAHWGRDRRRGDTLPLPLLVRKHTYDSARLVGFNDRGVVAPGLRADLNVIDFERLRVLPPRMAYDLPAGGKRLVQRAEGYRYTLVAGSVTFQDGEHTGSLPGRVVR
jgi:N-acyl-D-aspartate/D-glutamate deacylase